MNLELQKIDDLNALLKVQVVKEDYEEKVNNILKDYRKKARFDGFRPGMVPMGMIKKMYYKPVLIDEVNKTMLENIFKYLKENDINILGEPLPSEKESKKIDFDHDEEFEFNFDLGLSPEFELKFSTRDKVPYYIIKVSDDMINQTTDQVLLQYGQYHDADKIEGECMFNADLQEVDEKGTPVDDGLKVEEANLSYGVIKDEEIKKSLLGKKAGDIVIMDIKKAYPNDTEQISILRIEKDKLPDVSSTYRLTIKKVSQFKKAEQNQELYDKIFGEGEVKSDEEFRQKVKEDIENRMLNDSEYRYKIDAKEMMLKKFNLDLPAEFLKRWLSEVNKEKYSKEQIEKDFPNFENDLKWQIIKNKIIKENHIEVTEDEALNVARQMVYMQYQQYGIRDIPEEYLNNYAKELLKKEEEKKRIFDIQYEEKVFQNLKQNIKLDNKEISKDKFDKLFESKSTK